MGGIRVRLLFETVKNAEVSTMLGKSFIDKFVQGIFPTEGNIVPYNSQPMPVLMVHEASDNTGTTTKTTDVTHGSVMAKETEE